MNADLASGVTAGLLALSGWLVVSPARDVRAVAVVRRLAGRRWLQGVVGWATSAVGTAGFGPASRRLRARQRMRAVRALGALAAELEAGQPPHLALERSGGSPCVWPATVAAVHMGGDAVAGLGLDSRGHPVLRQLAACWQVGSESGAGLADAVGRLASGARAAEDVRVDLEGQLAGPRATARMLAMLPVVGVGFGMMLGSDPLAWLLGSTPGRACLVSGIALTALGMWWTGRIALRVERLL